MLRLVHLSDIHFGQEKDGGWEPHDDVRRELLIDLKRVRDTNLVSGPADQIIVTGDIAQAGKETEYKVAASWLDQALCISGAPKRAVKAVPGNHDVDLSTLGHDELTLQAMLRTADIDLVEAHIASLAGKAESPIITKLNDYRSFAYAYGTDFDSYSYPVTVSYHDFGAWKLRFFGLCTPILSDRKDKEGNLFLSGSQYRIPREEGSIDIVFMHHPPNWLRDQTKIEEYLNSRARVLMTGHEHSPVIKPITYETGFQQLRLAAGATNPPETGEGFEYSYSWLEFEIVQDAGCDFLAVTCYPRIWSKADTRFIADKVRGEGSENITHRLGCGLTRTTVSGNSPAQGDVQNVAVESPDTASAEILALSDSDEVASEMTQPNAFEELRLLFWQRLSQTERVDIFIGLGLLTEAARGRLPSAIERKAFEDASATGMLGQLWDKTMAALPADDRRDNPFGADV
ncbi:metallophosphoesterase [Sphingomonas cavernae]|uniref:Uncharacterized protein n=1 Tax=Sphingomonas cavernae TaxID=2320861 RepID=A0A418W7Y8_9SPHN|nr:metallophosphoesterase [Sphingomonas cavernae]RJF86114.1 hypothetical protein D3876_20070 [Sphingomonas cavernae]